MKVRGKADRTGARPCTSGLSGIDHVVVIAGPEASGKSTLIRGLMDGSLAVLDVQLGTANTDAWRLVCGPHGRLTGGCPAGRNALFHYNMIRPWQFPRIIKGFTDDPRLELALGVADRTFVTLWVEPAIIVGRWQERLRLNRQSATRIQRLRAKRRALRRWIGGYPSPLRLYTDAASLIRQYDLWIGFVAGCSPRAHWLVDVNGPTPRLLSVDDWKGLVGVRKLRERYTPAQCVPDRRRPAVGP